MQLHFNLEPLARTTDPITSHVAAVDASAKLGGWKAEFVARLRQRGLPSTANEVASGNESIRKRAGELERNGLIAAVGIKTCERTGKLATIYWVV
mgnify:CR=1 FL=1